MCLKFIVAAKNTIIQLLRKKKYTFVPIILKRYQFHKHYWDKESEIISVKRFGKEQELLFQTVYTEIIVLKKLHETKTYIID